MKEGLGLGLENDLIQCLRELIPFVANRWRLSKYDGRTTLFIQKRLRNESRH